MTTEERARLTSVIKYETFEYCFEHYHTWNDINDDYFQELKKNYLEAARKLKDYILIDE